MIVFNVTGISIVNMPRPSYIHDENYFYWRNGVFIFEWYDIPLEFSLRFL